ncbi:DNA excision repair protein ERCC-6-like protein, partial [Leptotrombidium deliense]
MDSVGSCGSEPCIPDEQSTSSDQFEVDLASIPCVENCKQLLSLGVKAYDQRCYEKNVLQQASKHFSQSYNDASTSESLSEEADDKELDIELQKDDSPMFSDENEDQEWIPSDGDSAVESDDETNEFSLNRNAKPNNETVEKRVKHELNDACRSRNKIIDDGVDKNYNKRLKLYKAELLLRNETISDDEQFTVVDGDFRLPTSVWEKLYPYQQSGVKWLWELHQNNCGGIIGDEMGLGKTIQVIAFLVGLKCSKIHCFREENTTLGPVILVCPATVMHQWVNEFHTWWPPFRVAILHHTGSFKGSK